MTRRKPKAAPDVDALVQRHWPYDGPHSHELVLTAAEAMVELAGYINNATLSDPDATLPHPEVSAKLVYYLQQAALKMQQAADQLLPPRRCWTKTGLLTATGSASPQDVLDEVVRRLKVASLDLSTPATHLGHVHSLLNRLGIESQEG